MTGTAKSQLLIDDCISKMNDEDKAVYRPIAEVLAMMKTQDDFWMMKSEVRK
jgi:hypothetical protein